MKGQRSFSRSLKGKLKLSEQNNTASDGSALITDPKERRLPRSGRGSEDPLRVPASAQQLQSCGHVTIPTHPHCFNSVLFKLKQELQLKSS